MGHSSAVELQMRRKGRPVSMAASSICITCESLVAALSLTDPRCLSSAKSTKYPRIPQPELEDIMGSHTKDSGLLQSPSEGITNPQAF